jgi:E3 ubiquitin-protein ligase RNF14
MSSSSGRRGQYHRPRHHNHRPLQIDDDHDHDHGRLLSPPSSSSSATTATVPSSNPATGMRRNSRWVSKNRRAHGFKPKPEVGCLNSLDSQLGSLSIAEKVNEKQEKEEEEEEEEEERTSEGVDGVFSRLEELQLGTQEPELSEELLRINDQLQEDELLAMESIYGDNVFNLDRHKGLRSFQIHIHVEAPGEIVLTAKLNLSGDRKTKNDSSDDFSYSFKVRHLPPIILTCLLPKSYPSHLPPYFTISVKWLDSSRISNLCSKLDSIWMEQPEQEVIYQWVEWLHSFSLSHLGFDKEITLVPCGIKHSGDRRAVSGIVSLDDDFLSMKSYNDERYHENFQNNLHECCICCSEYAAFLLLEMHEDFF